MIYTSFFGPVATLICRRWKGRKVPLKSREAGKSKNRKDGKSKSGKLASCLLQNDRSCSRLQVWNREDRPPKDELDKITKLDDERFCQSYGIGPDTLVNV
jgi:hypothetical protein